MSFKKSTTENADFSLNLKASALVAIVEDKRFLCQKKLLKTFPMKMISFSMEKSEEKRSGFIS